MEAGEEAAQPDDLGVVGALAIEDIEHPPHDENQ